MKEQSKTQLQKIIIYTAFSCYFIVLMEWLFFFSKPSFLNNWTFLESFVVLLIAPLPPFAFSLILLAPFLIYISLNPTSRISNVITVFSLIFPATILTCLVFLLFENFTYTIWKFNIGTFQGVIRYLYTLIIIVVTLRISYVLWKWSRLPFRGTIGRYIKLSAIMLLLTSSVLVTIKYTQAKTTVGFDELNKANGDFPNILILSTDGLNASNMSAYGYHRNTTPFITSLLPESLIIENHFTNNAQSTGSIGALFSGKLPTKTRVIYPPDIFRGIDVYQHMPGVLKKMGYNNADFSIRHYTDPYDLNLQEGFNLANGRKIGRISNNIKIPDFAKLAFVKEFYFLEKIFSRLIIRIQHALSIKDMVNPYKIVTNLEGAKRHFPDSKRISQLLNFINNSQAPFFAHVHLMGTHGAKFYPKQQVFSLGQKQKAEWMTDFYDDSILNYDKTVKKVINYLKEKNIYEKTLIILTSDHGSKWQANERIPLILRFPQKKYVGVRHNNVQRIDVTATIIDYLGIKKLEWMQGASFLKNELKRNRLIFFANSGEWGPQNSGRWRNVATYNAPYYSLGGVGVIVAQKWYYLLLAENKLLSGLIRGHTSSIGYNYLPSKKQAYSQIINHLKENNYPVPKSDKNH